MKFTMGAHFLVAMCILSSLISCSTTPENNNQLVRLAIIEVDTNHLQRYNEFLKEEIEASILKEPGVITLYGVAEKENPQRVTLFETYADSNQYRGHLATPHFQKYKQGTLKMVKHLDLIQMKPILYHRKPALSTARVDQLFTRLIKLEIEPNQIENFDKLGNTVMLPGIRKEPGVLVMYAVAEKDNPTRVSILEVYENVIAYNDHLKTSHYQVYKESAKAMIKTLKFIDVNPIALGSKPHQ